MLGIGERKVAMGEVARRLLWDFHGGVGDLGLLLG